MSKAHLHHPAKHVQSVMCRDPSCTSQDTAARTPARPPTQSLYSVYCNVTTLLFTWCSRHTPFRLYHHHTITARATLTPNVRMQLATVAAVSRAVATMDGSPTLRGPSPPSPPILPLLLSSFTHSPRLSRLYDANSLPVTQI